jgi:chorismate mutase
MNTIEVKEFNEKICNNSEDEVKNEMIELYNNLSNTENEDVYLSDGVWLRPDGTMYDEKSSH